MYTSTRAKKTEDASGAILKGLSKDGGLFLPSSFDSSFFSKELLNLSYKEVAFKVCKTLLNDMKDSDIKALLDETYGKHFKPSEVVIKNMDNVSFLELFHGPTFAFKDMALQVLPKLFELAKKIQKEKRQTIILTATSGDTGGATLSGFGALKDTHVIVLYPTARVSEFQEKQMLQYQSDTCHVLAVAGNFDDCQRIVKDIFRDVLVSDSIVSSANSINIGRIIPQIIYYVFSYLDQVKKQHLIFGEKMNVVVPTGNFGNIYAGYIAKKMGVPIGKLIIASNENNVLTDLFNKGEYQIERTLIKTSSPSMDIIVSSNFERLLYDLCDEDPTRVEMYMKRLQEKRKIVIDELKTQTDFYATYATEEDTLKSIKKVYDTYGYLIDPHTAVAYHCYETYVKETKDQTKTMIISTASPYKFSGALLKALNIEKANDLKQDIKTLKTYDNDAFDERIMAVLSTDQSPKVIALDETYQYVMKVIGDIDANH